MEKKNEKDEMIKCFEISFKPDECKVALNSDTIGTLKIAILPAFKEFMNYFNDDYSSSYRDLRVPRKICDSVCFETREIAYIVSFDFREKWKNDDINAASYFEYKAKKVFDYDNLKNFVTQMGEYIRTRTDISKLTKNASVYIKVNNKED